MVIRTENITNYTKISNENDIETIIPYIKKSYNLSKCVAIDIKYNINKLYLTES